MLALPQNVCLEGTGLLRTYRLVKVNNIDSGEICKLKLCKIGGGSILDLA